VAQGAQPERWALVVHGILGCGANWRTFARTLVERHPSTGVLLADLRHHGRSGPLDGEATIAACADDLDQLCRSLEVSPNVVLGHSFGGRVALALACRSPLAIERLWVLDSPLGMRAKLDEAGARTMRPLLEAMRSVPVPSSDRDAVVADLIARGLSKCVANWLTTNLRHDPAQGGYAWRVELGAIERLLVDYFAFDGWAALSALPSKVDVHLVRGARSDRWADEEWRRVETAAAQGRLRAHVLKNAGHWLHVDEPSGLLELLSRAAGSHRSDPLIRGVAASGSP